MTVKANKRESRANRHSRVYIPTTFSHTNESSGIHLFE